MNAEEESKAGVEECVCVGGGGGGEISLGMAGQRETLLPVHHSHPCPIVCLHDLRM